MSYLNNSNVYHVSVDSFIGIVHELELIPETMRSRNDSVMSSISNSDLERWGNLFGLTVSEARFIICESRAIYGPRRAPADAILRRWP